MIEMDSPEFAALLLRAERSPEAMTAVDSLRYRRFPNLDLNLYEAAYTIALKGTLEPEMAAGWLNGMPGVICRTGMRDFWEESRSDYHASFRAAMDSVARETTCRAQPRSDE
jgi:hypothetical protein